MADGWDCGEERGEDGEERKLLRNETKRKRNKLVEEVIELVGDR